MNALQYLRGVYLNDYVGLEENIRQYCNKVLIDKISSGKQDEVIETIITAIISNLHKHYISFPERKISFPSLKLSILDDKVKFIKKGNFSLKNFIEINKLFNCFTLFSEDIVVPKNLIIELQDMLSKLVQMRNKLAHEYLDDETNITDKYIIDLNNLSEEDKEVYNRGNEQAIYSNVKWMRIVNELFIKS